MFKHYLLNRLGHSDNYSFSLELETAIAEAAEETSHILTNQIVRDPGAQSVFHSEFDNFDQMINTLTDSGSVHKAHGIMIREVSGDRGTPIDTPAVPRSKRRSLELPSVELPDCYVTLRKSPQLQIHLQNYDDGP